MSVVLCSPVATSHNSTVLSEQAVAIIVPSGEKATAAIACPSSIVVLFFRVRVSHNRTLLSLPPVAIVFPSGENVTEVTPHVCSLNLNVVMRFLVFAFHK